MAVTVDNSHITQELTNPEDIRKRFPQGKDGTHGGGQYSPDELVGWVFGFLSGYAAFSSPAAQGDENRLQRVTFCGRPEGCKL